MLKQRGSQSQKQKLSSTMHSWLPILQTSLDALPEALEPFARANPFMQVRPGNERPDKKFIDQSLFDNLDKQSISETIEALTIDKKSLFETLDEQINPPLFPTKISQDIAYAIIENIDHEGYFEQERVEEIAHDLGVDEQKVEKVRERFAYLEPVGIGAVDLKEAFLFQLEDTETEEGLCRYIKKLIHNFESIESYGKDKQFNDALKVIKKFKNPPAIEFLKDKMQVVPDIFIYNTKNSIEVSLNDDYYPEILIETEGLDENHTFVASKIKDAKDLVDALDMRKATLYKIGLMIVEHQYEFFFGEDIRPMNLKDIADDLQRNRSTISRAISGKYLSCSRGIIPLKYFFAVEVEENISNSAIKEYVRELIKHEDRKKPFSDMRILALVEKRFEVNIVRRTIAKYRKEFNIAGSSERKKLYALRH